MRALLFLVVSLAFSVSCLTIDTSGEPSTPTPTPLPSPTEVIVPTGTPAIADLSSSAGWVEQEIFLNPGDIVPLIQRVRPSVVRVNQSSGVGSGAIFNVAGDTAYILTNEHVIDGSGSITVTVNDQDRYPASVLGKDARRDLAVLQICCGQFAALSFADPSEIMTGLPVVNMGYALGIAGEATVTLGIISAIRHNRNADTWELQSDAAMNPGNSGGPMISIDGELLGINTYIIKDSEGIGFAVSVETIQTHIDSLKSGAPTPQPTFTPTPRPTATPTIRPTSTPITPSTSGPTPTRRPTSTPTIAPSPTPTTPPTATREPQLFGPFNDHLRLTDDGRFASWLYDFTTDGDLTIQATFYNPPDVRSRLRYGVLFRASDESIFAFSAEVDLNFYSDWYLHHLTYIHEEGRWRWEEIVAEELIGGQSEEFINVEQGEANHLKVVVRADQVVELGINGTLIHDAYNLPYPQNQYYDIGYAPHLGNVGVFGEILRRYDDDYDHEPDDFNLYYEQFQVNQE